MDALAVILSIVYQFGTNGAFLLLCAIGADRHPRHDEHHQSRAWRTDDAGGLYRHDLLQPGVPFPARRDHRLLRRRAFRRRARTTDRAALLRPRTWRPGGHLGHQPHPFAGHFLILLGPFMPAIQIPEGSFRFGQYSFSFYWLALFAFASLLVVAPVVALQQAPTSACRRAPHAEPGNGARAWGSTRAASICSLSASAPALAGFSGALARADHVHHAVHGPAVRRPGLYHGRRRGGDQRHRRRRRQRAFCFRSLRRQSASCLGAFLGTRGALARRA